jgi:hypothetical protein
MQLNRIVLFVLTVLSLGACTVKLADDTPGAKKSCAQSEASMNTFYCGPFRSVIIGEGCTGCHIDGAAGGGAMKFDITVGTSCCPNCYATNAAVVSTNFCTAFLKGAKLSDFPQSDAHTADKLAQKFTANEIQELIDWVNEQQGN